MKNNNDHQYEIRKARQPVVHSVTTDAIVNPRVVEKNMSNLGPRQVRKRKTNYVKKILKDDFLMNL